MIVEVSDTGCGMTAEVRARALEPFFTTRSPGEGSGLGLSIVARIVRAHNGHLSIDSAAGGGTTVRVRLPLGSSRPEQPLG